MSSENTGAPLKILVIAGATATGKSDAAVETALRLGRCEIVSADSMQVYQGMDIGTAKAGARETALVPHHSLSIIPPTEEFTAARFQVLARQDFSDISSRGSLPILVGGSGLYIRAAIDPLDFPAQTPGSARRVELEALAESDPSEVLNILAEVDPDAIEHVDTANIRRVIRAIEAAEITKRSFTDRRSEWAPRKSIYDTLMVGVRLPRAVLVERIERRVDVMMENGLLEEVESLATKGRSLSQTAAQALGYKELLAYLRGQTTLEESVEKIKVRTRQLAKRQMTWFRADHRIHWLDVEGMDAGKAADSIVELVRNKRFIVS